MDNSEDLVRGILWTGGAVIAAVLVGVLVVGIALGALIF